MLEHVNGAKSIIYLKKKTKNFFQEFPYDSIHNLQRRLYISKQMIKNKKN